LPPLPGIQTGEFRAHLFQEFRDGHRGILTRKLPEGIPDIGIGNPLCAERMLNLFHAPAPQAKVVRSKRSRIALLIEQVVADKISQQLLAFRRRYAPAREFAAHIRMGALGAVAPLPDLLAGNVRGIFSRNAQYVAEAAQTKLNHAAGPPQTSLYIRRVKNRRAIYSLLAANAISGFAQGISLIAIPWYFASVLNMESYFVRGFQVITFLTLFVSLYSGTLIDRYNRKTLFLAINAAGAAALAGAAAWGFCEGAIPPIGIILVLAFAVFSFQVHFPNLYALGQEVVGKESYGRFSSMIEVQNQATIILSGMFAVLLLPDSGHGTTGIREALGWEYSPWEMHEIFLLDAATYAISFAIIARISYTPERLRHIETGTVAERLRTGFRYLSGHPRLFVFGVTSHALFVVALIHGFYLINLYIDNYLKEGSEIYAIGEILYSFGALLAGLAVRRIFRRWIPERAVLVLMGVALLICLMLAFTRSYIFIFLFQFLVGITNAGVRVLRLTYLLSRVDNDVIGRSESIFNTANIFLRFVALTVFGLAWFSEGDHVVRAYFAFAVFLGVAMIIMWQSAIRSPRKTH
jgi:MFS transporter, DHA3 family, macrolide efflux protein